MEIERRSYGKGEFMKSPEVCVVSAFNRGQWLAAALAEKNFKVKLIDVSSSLGRWAPEDWEGPFGLVQLENLSPMQLERLSEDDYSENVEPGFTLWLKERPLELQGPLALHSMEAMGLNKAYELLKDYHKKQELGPLQEYIDKNGFDKSWMLYLAYFFDNYFYQVGTPDFKEGVPLWPVTLGVQIRRATRRGLEKSLQWCESKGVECFRDVNFKDIQMDGRACRGVEISSSWSGVLQSDYYVWMLTGEESLHLNPKLVENLFPQGILHMNWSWVRYRLTLKESDLYDSIPLKFTMINDIHLPWTHDNFCIVQKGVSKGDLDVFIRVPSHHRFQKEYLEKMGVRVLNELCDRLPTKAIEILDMPQDYLYSLESLGPSRFGNYPFEQLIKYSHRKFKNLCFSSPEVWPVQSLSRILKQQEATLASLVKWNEDKNSMQSKEVEL